MDSVMVVSILVGILLLGVVLTALAFGSSYLLFKLLGRTSGLSKLVELYPATEAPAGEMYSKQWIAVGQVYYKNTTDICIDQRGLYVWVRSFLSKYGPVMIPWDELKGARPAIMAGRRAVRLTVGEPEVATIVVTQQLMEKLQPHMK